MPSQHSRRSARGGRGLLPPNPKQWENEHNGLDLRDDLGLAADARLPVEAAYSLLPNVRILPHGEVPAALKFIVHFRREGNRSWSGVAVRLPGDLGEVVIYNDSHPPSRVRATLMEEFFHIRLEHPRSTVRQLSGEDGWRSYDSRVEEEAYGSGASALVPYCALREMLSGGVQSAGIARHFEVSSKLVEYRMKVTKLYGRYGRKR